MDDRPRALITYDGLPISAGGAHRLRRKDRVASWQALLGFLGSYTTYGEPDDVRLALAEGPQTDGAFFATAYREAVSVFGRPQERVAMPGRAEEHDHRWRLSAGRIDQALALMERLEPFPEHWLGAPLVLHVRATFRLRDAESGEPFAGQDPALYGHQEAAWQRPLGLSRIFLRLTTDSTCGLFLSLPFPGVTPAVAAYIERLDGSLPFRLSKKHWSRWQLNARGTRYYNRRISIVTDA